MGEKIINKVEKINKLTMSKAKKIKDAGDQLFSRELANNIKNLFDSIN